MKTILLLMLMLRILVTGIELNCKTSDDPEFQSICKDSNDEIFKFCVNSTVCTFKSEEVGEENAEIEIMVDGNESNYTVIYKSKSVPILPSELYEKLSNLKSCVFYNISTIKIERDWFKYSQSLQELYVLHNAIPTMEGGKFIDLENLQKLNLTSNEIEEIDENAFVGLKKLLIIDLSDNKIKDFHTNLFRDLTYLKELYSDGNPIKTLDEEIFKNLQNLEVLMLIHSDLDYIQRGIFSNNRNLKDLRLRGRISRIDEDAFLGLEKLSYLDISDHLLEIMPPNLFKDLTSLKKLIISNSCNLKYLNVTLFENLRNLEFLQIDSAEFEEVPDGIFRNTINLETLHLQGKISKMSNKIFSHLKKLKGLDLTDNLCASGYNPHHQASIVFMEDALLPCSCKRPRKEDSDVKLKKLLIYSGLVGVIILFIFVCLLRHSQEEENLGKKSSIFRIVFNEYVDNSSMQGLKYISNKGFLPIGRIFWVTILLISTTAFVYYSCKTYIRWQERPVILGTSEKLTDSFEIPFPAVTFCPNFKFNKKMTDLRELLKLYEAGEADQESIKKLEVAAMLCGPKFQNKLKHSPVLKNRDILKILQKEWLLWQDMTWRKRKMPSYFSSKMLTADGLCVTFNSISADLIFRNDTVDPDFLNQYQFRLESRDLIKPKYWNMEDGYEPNKINNYPVRSVNYGSIYGLFMHIKIKEDSAGDIDIVCRDNSMSLKVYVHHPAEVPSMDFFLVPLNKSANFLIKPQITWTSKNLVSYDPAARQCYFPGERQLKFFKIYTRTNCEFECLTNLTQRYCNCSTFFMPRTKDTSICNYQQHGKCLTYAHRAFSFIYKLKADCDSESLGERSLCACYPLCNEVRYDASSVLNDYQMLEPELDGKYSFYRLNEINLYFKERQFASLERSELFGFIDFISNCGGLMGLFMGISLLSFVEIFYYFLYLIYQLVKNYKVTDNRVYDLKARQ